MKASVLLEELKESMKNYDIHHIKKNLKKEDINPISKQVALFNLKNYDEIMIKTIDDNEDYEISDDEINDIKNEMIIKKAMNLKKDNDLSEYVEIIRKSETNEFKSDRIAACRRGGFCHQDPCGYGGDDRRL